MNKPPTKVIIIAAVALVVVCCGGVALTAVFGVGKVKDTKAASAPVAVQPSLPGVVIPSINPRSPSPTASPVVPLKMPSLVGQNAAVAQDILKRSGFTRVELGSADPGDSIVLLPQNWTVKEQSATAEQTIPSDTLIVLTCTKKR